MISAPTRAPPVSGQNKTPHPCYFSGVRRNIPRFHPACKKRGGRREQREWTGARASGKPRNGLQTGPSRREAARREQAQRDSLPLETSVTGGSRPGRPGRLRSGTAAAFRKTLPPSGSLSVRCCAVSSPSKPINGVIIARKTGFVKGRSFAFGPIPAMKPSWIKLANIGAL